MLHRLELTIYFRWVLCNSLCYDSTCERENVVRAHERATHWTARGNVIQRSYKLSIKIFCFGSINSFSESEFFLSSESEFALCRHTTTCVHCRGLPLFSQLDVFASFSSMMEKLFSHLFFFVSWQKEKKKKSFPFKLHLFVASARSNNERRKLNEFSEKFSLSPATVWKEILQFSQESKSPVVVVGWCMVYGNAKMNSTRRKRMKLWGREKKVGFFFIVSRAASPIWTARRENPGNNKREKEKSIFKLEIREKKTVEAKTWSWAESSWASGQWEEEEKNE